eukprot:478171-Amphidinium_carterae.10
MEAQSHHSWDNPTATDAGPLGLSQGYWDDPMDCASTTRGATCLEGVRTTSVITKICRVQCRQCDWSTCCVVTQTPTALCGGQETRKITGCALHGVLWNLLLHAHSRTQTARALSSGEAEWYGSAALLYAQQLIIDVGITVETTVPHTNVY